VKVSGQNMELFNFKIRLPLLL